ncbi:MAG: hypothetical protein ACRDQD_28870, partial [Nocardioidaceae bacterium]
VTPTGFTAGEAGSLGDTGSVGGGVSVLSTGGRVVADADIDVFGLEDIGLVLGEIVGGCVTTVLGPLGVWVTGGAALGPARVPAATATAATAATAAAAAPAVRRRRTVRMRWYTTSLGTPCGGGGSATS